MTYHIIIAEDETALARMLVRFILRIYPAATVQAFENGQHALDAYDRDGADLLVVNPGMPGLDGPTIIRTLRARGDTVPIIGMSGNPLNRNEYVEAGAMVFVDICDLLGQIPELLRDFLPARSS